MLPLPDPPFNSSTVCGSSPCCHSFAFLEVALRSPLAKYLSLALLGSEEQEESSSRSSNPAVEKGNVDLRKCAEFMGYRV